MIKMWIWKIFLDLIYDTWYNLINHEGQGGKTLKNKINKIHSKAFIDGIIINDEQEEIIYNHSNKTVTKRESSNLRKVLSEIPIIRGCVKTVKYFLLSIKSLNFTLNNMEKELDETNVDVSSMEEKILDKLNIKLIHLIYFCGLMLGFIAALILFVLAPSVIVSLISKIFNVGIILSILEGSLRLLSFFLFIKLSRKIPEIKRMAMYHGAEHKVLNCIRTGKELTIENVKQESRYNINCATYNLYKLSIIMILYFSFFSFDGSYLVNLVMRILLFPIIVGITYEFKILFIENKQTISKFGRIIQDVFLEEPSDEITKIVINSIKELKVKETK